MNLSEAQNIANEFTAIIEPFTERIVIAGSIRRQCETVNDIDIVIKQKSYHLQKFFLDKARDTHIMTKKTDPLLKLKHGSRQMEVMFQGRKLELYLATDKNFGLITLIRTGSAKFSQSMLAEWKKVSHGGESRDGILRKGNGEPVLVPDEEKFFDLVGMDFVPPVERNI